MTQTYRQSLLTQTEPLERHEIAVLKDWLKVLQDDCALFGATPCHVARMTTIKARIAASERELAADG